MCTYTARGGSGTVVERNAGLIYFFALSPVNPPFVSVEVELATAARRSATSTN